MSYSFPLPWALGGSNKVKYGLTQGFGTSNSFFYTGPSRHQAAGTVFSWFNHQECWGSLHTEIFSKYCEYVYKDIQTGNYNWNLTKLNNVDS